MYNTLIVKMNDEAESGVIEHLTGRGWEIGLDSEEYNDDGTVTLEYTIRMDAQDANQAGRILANVDDVIEWSFE